MTSASSPDGECVEVRGKVDQGQPSDDHVHRRDQRIRSMEPEHPNRDADRCGDPRDDEENGSGGAVEAEDDDCGVGARDREQDRRVVEALQKRHGRRGEPATVVGRADGEHPGDADAVDDDGRDIRRPGRPKRQDREQHRGDGHRPQVDGTPQPGPIERSRRWEHFSHSGSARFDPAPANGTARAVTPHHIRCS